MSSDDFDAHKLIINESGYPLQIALQNIIKCAENDLKWMLLSREHRNVNPTNGEEGFIDLILENNTRVYRIVVECKRLAGAWDFLIPQNEMKTVTKAVVLRSVLDPGNRWTLSWTDIDISPRIPKAVFCVPIKNDKTPSKDSRLLEKIAGELLIATENLANEEKSLWDPYGKVRKLRIYIPMIVTTAKLNIYSFNPNEINLENGTIDSMDHTGTDYILFKKNLSTNIQSVEMKIEHLGELNKANDRTVFIIKADKFLQFLDQLDFG